MQVYFGRKHDFFIVKKNNKSEIIWWLQEEGLQKSVKQRISPSREPGSN